MRVSVFTPSHDPATWSGLPSRCASSPSHDWEWIVLLNGKAPPWTPPGETTPGCKVYRAPHGTRASGAAKRAACELAGGDILVELDHDDLLSRGCLAQVVDAFRRSARWCWRTPTSPRSTPTVTQPRALRPGHGWVYTPGTIDGQLIRPLPRARPHPAQHRLHLVRAQPRARLPPLRLRGGRRLRRRAGVPRRPGADVPALPAGEFHQINRCLYFQRVHAQHPGRAANNAAIQEQTSSTTGSSSRTFHRLGQAQRPAVPAAADPDLDGAPDERFEDVMVDPAPRVALRRRQRRADPGLRRPAADARPGGVLQRVLPGARPRRHDPHPDAAAPMAAAPSRTPATPPSTTRTASCTSPRRAARP